MILMFAFFYCKTSFPLTNTDVVKLFNIGNKRQTESKDHHLNGAQHQCLYLNCPALYFTFFPYLNQHDVIVEWPGFVIIMSDDGRDWEHLFESLVGVDAVLSQDHLQHAGPEGGTEQESGRGGGFKRHKSDISDQAFNVARQKTILLLSDLWLEFKNGNQLWKCSYSRSPAVGGRHHPLGVDEGASTEVVAHEKKGSLVLDGVRLHHYSPDDSLPKHI